MENVNHRVREGDGRSVRLGQGRGALSMARWVSVIVVLLLTAFVFASCKEQESRTESPRPTVFNPETLKIPDGGGRKIRGQVLYMPIYSNIPYSEKRHYDLSAFLAIHNTDLKNRIKITRVDFFNTDGKVVNQFIAADQWLDPLATAIFTIPQKDQSGTGANFLVEWMADQPVNEPLIESIMKDLSGNLGLSFLSTGRVIREMP